MADPDTLIKAKIHYYGREKYYHSMQIAAVEGMKRFSGDPAFKFFYGMALVLEGRVQEGIRELDPLQSYSEVMLGSLLALIHAHKLCLTVDKEAVASYDAKLKEERKRADDQALYYAGVFLLHIDKGDKAKEYVDRLLKINPQSKDGLVLKGWVEVLQLRGGDGTKTALPYFEAVLKTNARNIEALFGKAKYFELCGLFDEANQVLSTLVVIYPKFAPPLVEKMKIELCVQDWEQAEDTAGRILALDPRNIEGARFKILQLICRKGQYEDASMQLRRLFADLEKTEQKNAIQFKNNAQLFSRICGKDVHVLEATAMFAEKAASIDSTSSACMTEVGYQCLLRGKVKEAQRYYKTATKLDESSVLALSGIIACQLQEKQFETAKEQLDFLKEFQSNIGNKSEILYMSAVLGRQTGKPPEEVLANLNDAVETHFKSVRGLPFGAEYLTVLNPDYVTTLVKEYLMYVPTEPSAQGQAVSPALKKTLMILEPVTKACPGLRDAQFLVAKAKYLSSDLKSAVSTLHHILDNLDPTFAEAHLLMAQVQLQQGNYMNAQQSLEVGLSYNFEVRDHPIYHLINAKVQKEKGDVKEAIKTLQTAMALLNKGKGKPGSAVDFSRNDRVSLYLELADCYRMNGQSQEATRIMQEAMGEYQGTAEEIRITVANADLALEKGDVETALGILRAIGPEQSYFLQAREKMANIYLHHRKDKRMYAQCYKQIVEKAPTAQSYVLLGDAYMSIQEPDRALEVYEQAIKRNPRDSLLAAKMGQALQRTHQYGKAINYYKEAIKSEDNNNLRYDMAELQMKLKQYEKAEKTVAQGLEAEAKGQNDLNSLMSQAKFYSLLANIYERNNNLDAAVKTLGETKDIRSRILKRVQVEQPDSVLEQRQLTAKVCHQIAGHAVMQRKFDLAIQHYKEALQFYPDDEFSLCSLARLYLLNDDLDQCQYTCMTLLRNDKENEEATVMMADLAFRKNDYESAMFHFQQLLQKRPDYWVALARLVEVMRRTGHLEDVPQYLAKSEEYVGTRASIEPGLCFCRGLYEWYAGNPNDSLKLFNKARKDNDWGQRAIYNMIEICLNPDNQMIGGEVFEGVDSDVHADSSDSQEMALRTAEKLLKELKPKPGQQMVSYQLLQGMLQLATKNKANIERALQDFMTIAAQEVQGRENVGAILGIAVSYQLLKQTPRARNQLKRVAKHSWNFEDAEHLERCWLLLADIYIQGGKYDMATELLRKVLLHNKSSTKAYEYMGYIMEKESSYKDAAQHYEQAWKYSNKSNPTIGYKLAFNYMKAKRFTDAIDVCHDILNKYPNYPKIRKEVLEKSRDNLKR